MHPLVRLARLLLVTWLAVACGRGEDVSGDDDGIAETDPADARPDGPSVTCPNLLQPAKSLTCTGDAPVCCLGGQLGLKPRCAESVQACGQDGRLACDDAWDCPDGKVCCLAQLSSGGSQKLFGTCAARCNLLQKRICSGPDASCGGEGQTCCAEDGDAFGSCVPEGATCPVDSGR